MEEYARDSQLDVGKGVDLKSPKPFINLAANIFTERGEKSTFPGMNPVVRRYLIEARRGYYRTPEEVNQALLDMKDEMLYEYFPEEYADLVATRNREAENRPSVAEGSIGTRSAKDFESYVDKLDSSVLPKELSEGGRVKLI
mgnify:FL=1|tara:strand:- start:1091 stop:1516 length:426 start_codon:yes stop_codon:yes gene_type:complete